MKSRALNGYFVLEPYALGQGIRKEIRGGLALPGQKLNLVPLKMKAASKVEGDIFEQGSIAYIAEDTLSTAPWAKSIRTAPGIEGEFIVVEARYVVMVTESKQDA